MSPSEAKTCIICGQDCADRARIRDDRGNYACRSCYEAKRRPKPTKDDLAETREDMEALDEASLDDTGSDAFDASESLANTTAGFSSADTDGFGAASGSMAAAPAERTQSASFHDLTSLDAGPADVCPRCGRPLTNAEATCPDCGEQLEEVGAIAHPDRLTAMGFLFTEEGAWRHGAKTVLGIMGSLALLSVFVDGCLFAGVTIVVMMAVAAWGWAVWNKIMDRDFAWAIGLFLAYPVPGLGTLVVAYHAYKVNKRPHFKQFHSLLFLSAFFMLLASGVWYCMEMGLHEDLMHAIKGDAS